MLTRNPRRLSAVVIVPLVLVIADLAADRTALKFLLLPPFAALTYLVFVNPAHVDLNVRRIVVTPTLTGAYAWVLANTLGYGVGSVILATVGTMAIMWLLDTPTVVPPLALALLTLLLHREVQGKVGYIISVGLFTIAVYVMYRLWLLLPLERWQAAGQGPAS